MAILPYNFAIQFGFFWRGGNMGNKQKVTIIVDATILKEIDKLSKSQGESRSRLIEDAIRVWREKELEKELIDGYLAMAKEDGEMAEANLGATEEVLSRRHASKGRYGWSSSMQPEEMDRKVLDLD